MKKVILMMALTTVMAVPSNAAQLSKKDIKKEVVDSTTTIIDKAKAGNAVAQNTLGVWYYTGKDSIKQDYNLAIQWWARAAKQDNADAIGNMAMCYQLGRGTEKDSVMAVKLYETAIKKGNTGIIPQHETIVRNAKNVFSCLLLRNCYMKGIGVKKDPKLAAKYQQIAAEGGHADSQFTLGLNSLNKNEVEKAVGWFKNAADQEHVGATYYYGYLLLNGMGIDQNTTKAIQYLHKAAKKGFPTADYQLGIAYKDGNGVEKDIKKAFDYFKKAAYHGNADAKWHLGNMYLKGEGTSVDYYFATQWLAEVAMTTHKKQFNDLLQEDNEGTYSQYLMGLRKYYVDKDYATAINLFKKVEKAKNVEGTTMLGVCYANKEYAKRNLKKAIKKLSIASENSPAASYYLSAMYETGTGVEMDDKQAVQLLVKAAGAGVAYALCKLGDRYMVGEGISKDMNKAALLYLEAEAQNHLTPQSAKNLIDCYKKRISALPYVEDAEKRIEAIGKAKPNGNLTALLKALEK